MTAVTLDRAAARKRCAAATPGPWCAGHRDDGPERILRTNGNGCSASSAKSNYRRVVMTEANRFFIAHARTDLPLALDALDAADRRVTELEAALRRIQEWDCLNPPDPELCHDHPWLRRLVDDALEKSPWPPT